MKPAMPNWAAMAFNVLGFQIVWLLCVWGSANSNWQIALFAAVVFAALSFLISTQRRLDLRTLLIALPVGFMMDSILAQSGLLRYASPLPSLNWAPLWIMALWLGFAMTLNHSLRVIYQDPWRTFLFGFIGGPMAYGIAALRFEAMIVQSDPWLVFLAVAAVWGLGLSLIRAIDFRQRKNWSKTL
jgi:hypothetical protein